MLPPNASSAERALSETTARLGDVPLVARETWNPDTCPTSLLAWLAWAFSVDEWNSNWTDTQKRETIKRSVAVHRYKGTIGAVRSALAGIASNARIHEWFNQVPAGDPYTFRLLLEADQIGIDQAGYDSLLKVVERTKNLRSHLEQIELTVKTTAGPYAAACAMIGSEITLTNYVPLPLVFNETTICI